MEKINKTVPPQKNTAKNKAEDNKNAEDLTPKSQEEKKEEKKVVKEEPKKEVVSEEAEDLEQKHRDFKASMKPEPDTTKKKEENDDKKRGIDHTETYDLNPKESQKKEQTTFKVNFMKPNAMSEFIKKSTNKGAAKEGEEKDEKGNPVEDPKSKESSSEEASDGSAFSKEDFEDFAEVFMDILDMGISTALRFYSKDTATTEYELDINKKRRLIRQLTKLFMKYQTKFSLEFMFFVTLVIAYSVPVSKANKRRKQLKSGEEVKRGPGQPKKR